MYILEGFENNNSYTDIDVSNYNSIYEIMEESELAVHQIFQEMYSIDREEQILIETKDYQDAKYTDVGDHKELKGQSKFKVLGDKIKNVAITIKNAIIKGITIVGNMIKNLYNKVFNNGQDLSYFKEAEKNKEPIAYNGYDIKKYASKEFIIPYEFCKAAKMKIGFVGISVEKAFNDKDIFKPIEDEVEKSEEHLSKMSKFTTMDGLAKDMLGEKQNRTITVKEVKKIVKTKFNNFDKYINQAKADAEKVCKAIIDDLTTITKFELNVARDKGKLFLIGKFKQLESRINSIFNRCKTQYLSYLNAEANLLKYMSKLAHFICRKAVSNKQNNDKKEDETVKESLTPDKKNAL